MLNNNYEKNEIRTRYAPSPTGYLHIGGARTALFNYLFSKKNNGKLILRIEDTDKERSKKKFEEDIIKSLKWLRIKWDEGPNPELTDESTDIPKYIGKYGPYRQSERSLIYTKYLKKLLEERKAYHCFCTKEELEAYRQYQISIGQAPKYSGKCRNLPESKVKKYLAEGRPSVIRFKVPEKKILFKDLIRGNVEFDCSLFGDIIIGKDLDTPLYNFTAAVDDFKMNITHIIRGEDHLSNTPKQILIQEALGFPHPIYAHLPLILGPDRSKLSKRHGASSITKYKDEGFLSESMINFMALLGWNAGDDKEILSMSSLIKKFSLEKIQKSGAIFNIKKLIWMNGYYIRQKSLEQVTKLCLPYLIRKKIIIPTNESSIYNIAETGEKISLDILKKIILIYQDRLKVLSHIVELTDFFFKKQLKYNKDLLRWKEASDEEIKMSLDKSIKILSKIKEDSWTKEKIETVLMPVAERFVEEIQKNTGDRGYLLWPLRVALSGKRSSAGPFEIAEILGKEKTIKRLREAIDIIKEQ